MNTINQANHVGTEFFAEEGVKVGCIQSKDMQCVSHYCYVRTVHCLMNEPALGCSLFSKLVLLAIHATAQYVKFFLIQIQSDLQQLELQ
jgi:hypothetical protein